MGLDNQMERETPPEQPSEEPEHVSPEQQMYAKILFYGSRIAMALMVITFFLYLTGTVEPYVANEAITEHWDKPVDEYAKAVDVPRDWGWAGLLDHGDFVNFLGIALLGVLTVVGYGVLIPAYIRKRDWCFTGIVVIQIIVLVVAISGILGSGSH